VDPPEVVVHASKKKQRTILLIAGLVGVIGAVAIGAYLSQPADEEYAEMPEIVINRDLSAHKDLPISPAEQPETAANSDGVALSTPSTPSAHSTTRPPVGGQVTSSASASTPKQATPSSLDDLLGMGSSVDPNAGLPGAKVLTSDAEIQEMVSRTIGFKLSQVEACYNRRLKEQEDLAGTWQASWKITKSGTTSGISVRGRGVSDSGLESCIKNRIQSWSFQKINRDYPVTIPFKLGV
jgi:hypothetical protein